MEPDEIRAKLRPYLEGRLSREQVGQVQAFLDATPEAREILTAMIAEEDRVALRLAQTHDEGGSLSDIDGPISRSARMAAMGRARRRSPRGLRSLLWVGIALLAAIVLFLYQRPGEPPEDWILTAPLDDMRMAIEVGRAPDLESSDPDAVRGWFAGRVDFTPPRPLADPGAARLIGGRLAHFLERPAAGYLYETGAGPVTLYVMAAQGLPEMEAEGIVYAPLEERRPEGAGGYRQVIWRAGALFYALVGALPRDRLVAIAEGFIGGG